MLITFSTIHHLIKAEHLLKEKGIKGKILPLPPKMADGCGMGLEVQEGDLSIVMQLFEGEDLLVRGLWQDASYK